MELNYLREFLALVECCNFREAAKKMGITQPTLSNHIKALEAELGVPLFERNTKKVELSEYGRVLKPYAKRNIALYKECLQDINSQRYRSKSIITIAAPPRTDPRILTETLCAFKKDNPFIILEMIRVSEDKAREFLKYGRCHFVFIPQLTMEDSEYNTVNLYTDHAVALVKKGNPFVHEPEISIPELKNERLFIPEADSLLSNILLDAFRINGFEPHIGCAGGTDAMAVSLARQGMGAAVVSDRLAREIQDDSLFYAKIVPELRWHCNLLYPKEFPTMSARRLLEYMMGKNGLFSSLASMEKRL